MRVRIERIEDNGQEEVVVYCRTITPEVESLIQLINQKDNGKLTPSFFKGDEQYYLSLREILFFETDAERVYAHTADNAYEVNQRLYELEAMLPAFFVRVSRSGIVSILHVFSIQKSLTRVNLISFRHSHKEIYGSRLYSNELFRKMNERYLYENT
jgi:DNA-binding LytR/AlgR family response regulator